MAKRPQKTVTLDNLSTAIREQTNILEFPAHPVDTDAIGATLIVPDKAKVLPAERQVKIDAAAKLIGQQFDDAIGRVESVLAAADSIEQDLSRHVVGLARFASSIMGHLKKDRIEKIKEEYNRLCKIAGEEILARQIARNGQLSAEMEAETDGARKLQMASGLIMLVGKSYTDKMRSYRRGRYWISLSSKVRTGIIHGLDFLAPLTKGSEEYALSTARDVERVVSQVRKTEAEAEETASPTEDQDLDSGNEADAKLDTANGNRLHVEGLPPVIRKAVEALEEAIYAIPYEKGEAINREDSKLRVTAAILARAATDLKDLKAGDYGKHLDNAYKAHQTLGTQKGRTASFIGDAAKPESKSTDDLVDASPPQAGTLKDAV